MDGQYDLKLVALSIAVAVIASYAALELAGCVSSPTSSPRKSRTWLVAGAFSMGAGIWSMHFIGMLAFRLPIPVTYSLPTSVLSMIIAIIVSAAALFILRRPILKRHDLIVGAVLMGIGISSMHYTGMMAMQMNPPIRYDPTLFAASVLIAAGASLAALSIASQLRGRRSRLAVAAKLVSAAVMGLAIAGMHYTGMAAAHFAHGSICLGATSGGIDNTLLAVMIAACTVAILSLTLIVSALDAHFAASNARLAISLQKITGELQAAQSELVTAARQAGMAEIATNVLHNVGNVLTSVNVSADLIATRMRETKAKGLADAVQLMNDHAEDLDVFLTRDERGKRLPGYLGKLAGTLATERNLILQELESLTKGIDHIRDIVATQQSYAGDNRLMEPVSVSGILEDALRMNGESMARREVTVVKEWDDLPQVSLDKHVVLQIFINLIANAIQAMGSVTDRTRQLTLRAGSVETTQGPRLRIQVEDNGEGIIAENMPRLFTHGFTTRKNGHGFGLHSCALAAHSMDGQLVAHSDGAGKGATFTLDLPMQEPLAQGHALQAAVNL
ncbi:MAG TPA: MHYT domain-containing protein [Rhizomicrobium sp.]|jgi:NO-binding membrane sensor protein with MHYT domain|nr:MHYT domain-containing protein [Rhizomicrobium sp.]